MLTGRIALNTYSPAKCILSLFELTLYCLNTYKFSLGTLFNLTFSCKPLLKTNWRKSFRDSIWFGPAPAMDRRLSLDGRRVPESSGPSSISSSRRIESVVCYHIESVVNCREQHRYTSVHKGLGNARKKDWRLYERLFYCDILGNLVLWLGCQAILREA